MSLNESLFTKQQMLEIRSGKKSPTAVEVLRAHYEKPWNLWDFCNDVIGFYNEEGTNLIDNDLHRWFCSSHAEISAKKKLYLLPRGHLKSSIITVSKAIQTILAKPNTRILLTNATESNAVKFLLQIENILMNNEIINYLWPEVIPRDVKKVRWSGHAMEINRPRSFPEATIEVKGVGGNLVSRHYDIIIYDDIINIESSTTKDNRQKTRDWFDMTTPLLEVKGERWMLGTRYHYDDIYNDILEDKSWKSCVRKVIEKDKNGKECFIYPQVFNELALESIKDDMKNKYLFSAQYYNDPIDVDNATFKRENLDHCFYEKIPKCHLCFTTVDLALSKKTSDDNVVMTCMCDEKNRLYTLDYVSGHLTPTDVIKAIFNHWDLYKPQIIGIEAVAYQGTLIHFLDKEQEAKGLYLPIQELKPKSRSKEHRIQALEPRMRKERPSLFIRPQHKEIYDQLLRFPRGKDDLIDALAYQLDIIYSADATDSEQSYDEAASNAIVLFPEAGY